MSDIDRAGEKYALLMGKAEFLDNVNSHLRWKHKDLSHRLPSDALRRAEVDTRKRAEECRVKAFALVEKAAKELDSGVDGGADL